MTNEEKYKTPDERVYAFRKYCRDNKWCKNYQLDLTKGQVTCIDRCILDWLAREAKEELLPCPFCGGDAESEFIPSFRNSHFVRCKICLSSIRGYDTKDKAIAAWNRRVK